MPLEIDVQPLAPGIASFPRTDAEHLRGNTLASIVGLYHRIQNESMESAVPRYIDKADQLFAGTRAHPTETMPIDLTPPIVLEKPVAKRLGM